MDHTFFPWWLLVGQDDLDLLLERTVMRFGWRQLGDSARLLSSPGSAYVPCEWHLMALVNPVSDVNLALIFHSSVTSCPRLNH